MLQAVYPSVMAESVEKIRYDKLWEKGFRGLIFDIDNTLVPHGAEATPKSRAFFAYLHEIGFETCLLSNNHPPRVEPFAHAVKSRFLCNAHKPSKVGFQQAIAEMSLREDQVALIGDQIFTDIWGANRSGIVSILTNPIQKKKFR